MKQLVCLIIITQMSIFALAQNKFIHLRKSADEYKALGLIKDTIKSWEGGSRTAEDKNSSQCWYYDAHLEDGTNVVMSFNLRDGGSLKKKITPYISIDIRLADGRKIGRTIRCTSEEFTSSREKCDVHIGKNYIIGDLKNYVIHIDDDAIKLDITFEKTAESWRPETGYLNFGDSTSYCGWLVPVPEGKTNVTYTVFNTTSTSKGICYHDNTWWNKSPRKQIDKWCWSSTRVGPFKVITYEITAEKKYNKERQFFYAVFKDGKLIIDDESKVTILKSYGIIQPIGKKPISNTLSYTYKDGENIYELILEKKLFLASSTPIKGKLMQKLVKLFTGFDGAYYRIRSNATFNMYNNTCLKETYQSDTSMWELFFFGDPN